MKRESIPREETEGREETTMTATFLSDESESFRGTAHVYRVSPPIDGHKVVVISKTNLHWLPESYRSMLSQRELHETYIFPWSLRKKDVSNWIELHGSQKGDVSIEQVLIDLGYEVRTGR